LGNVKKKEIDKICFFFTLTNTFDKRYFRIVGQIGLTKHIKFINTRLSIKILEMKLHIQSSVKSIGKRKKKHILSKNYCEDSHLSKVLGNVKKIPI
jgi:hypothetical protein